METQQLNLSETEADLTSARMEEVQQPSFDQTPISLLSFDKTSIKLPLFDQTPINLVSFDKTCINLPSFDQTPNTNQGNQGILNELFGLLFFFTVFIQPASYFVFIHIYLYW